ncbi:hypothetical protein GCM10025858_14280 [Alicyclobacillus sacchari]|uniref:hypothetical protein n=1 Tax=Alicyclobacillus sacchari TaxID=392010 RepID=UPI0023E9A0FC|nr:hypothetical protein [Alicyclobacillus sacchari]GMA56925.1 hypothetical protein GCM10025858_14280 [Alicyclobacillus sacchari]
MRLSEAGLPQLRHRASKALVGIGWLMLVVGIGLDLPLQTAITWNVHGASAFSARYIERTLNLTVFGYLWLVQMLILLIVPPMVASLMLKQSAPSHVVDGITTVSLADRDGILGPCHR